MNIVFPRNIKEFRNHLKDPLYKNSFYILLTMVIGGLLGFIFWIVAAKLYSQEEVGITTALISAVNLIVILSFLGLDQSIIRFFPEGNRTKIFITSLIAITMATVIFGVIFVAGINIWSPQLSIVKEYLFIFFVTLVSFSLIQPTSQVFIALRKGNYYFYQNLLMGLRALILFLPFLGKFGIFISFGLASLISLLFSMYFIFKFKIEKFNLKKQLRVDVNYLKDSFRFSIGNYVFVILITIPGYLLPILVLNVLGSEQTAYYYIAYTIGSVLFMISAAFGTSLFVEGSHGESLRKNTLKTTFATFIVLIPIAILLFIFGGYILGLIGANYINGLNLLKTIILSSFFYAVCMIYFSISRVQKNMSDLIVIGLLIFILLIGFSYIFMLKFGIVGVGYAWIVSYFAGSIFVILKIRKLK